MNPRAIGLIVAPGHTIWEPTLEEAERIATEALHRVGAPEPEDILRNQMIFATRNLIVAMQHVGWKVEPPKDLDA